MPTFPTVSIADGSGTALALTSAGAMKVDASASSSVTSFLTYVLVPQAAANVVGNSFSTASVSCLAIDITLSSFTGGTTPTITFFLDRFGADGTWYRVWTSSALNSAGATSVQVGPFPAGTGIATAVLTGTARFGWSTTGSPTAVTFSGSVVGR
ncbi:hypothetical protein ACFYUY_01345 [Kitasatospora sp. NPDC004745]|uniref:hypothetical protein n=1 Tax=Kitasatospora sp. NPDC004745 TaxID=3364019 RepID=UPI0036BB9EC6